MTEYVVELSVTIKVFCKVQASSDQAARLCAEDDADEVWNTVLKELETDSDALCSYDMTGRITNLNVEHVTEAANV